MIILLNYRSKTARFLIADSKFGIPDWTSGEYNNSEFNRGIPFTGVVLIGLVR
jgi:hypothetical protein